MNKVASGDGGGCESVPEIMQAQIRQSCELAHSLPRLLNAK